LFDKGGFRKKKNSGGGEGGGNHFLLTEDPLAEDEETGSRFGERA